MMSWRGEARGTPGGIGRRLVRKVEPQLDVGARAPPVIELGSLDRLCETLPSGKPEQEAVWQ
jgi:hypothetical protein